MRTEARVEVTEAVREWDYGDYEGMTSKAIKAARAEKGEEPWDIWKHGCPGGEYVLSSISILWFIQLAGMTERMLTIVPTDPPKTSPGELTPLSRILERITTGSVSSPAITSRVMC